MLSFPCPVWKRARPKVHNSFLFRSEGHRRAVQMSRAHWRTARACFFSKRGGNFEYLELPHQEIGCSKREDTQRDDSVRLREKTCEQSQKWEHMC